MMIGWVLNYEAAGVRSRMRPVFKLDIYEELGWNRSYLLIDGQIWKVEKVEVRVDCRLFLLLHSYLHLL